MELNQEKKYLEEPKKYCVYKHICPNGKIYIGQTCQNPKRRWRDGLGYIQCPYFYNAIKKYGWKNIKHEIIAQKLTHKEANDLETHLITEVYKSNIAENGYNLDYGGSGSNSCNGTKWWNNGIIEKRCKVKPGEDWILGQLKSHHLSLCKERIVDGKKYASLKEVMEAFNTNRHTARVLCGMRIPKDVRKRIIINGIEYESIQEAHRKTGLSIRQINKIRGLYKLKGYNYDRITKQCIPITINGIKYKSMSKAIKELNMSKYYISKLYHLYGNTFEIPRVNYENKK